MGHKKGGKSGQRKSGQKKQGGGPPGNSGAPAGSPGAQPKAKAAQAGAPIRGQPRSQDEYLQMLLQQLARGGGGGGLFDPFYAEPVTEQEKARRGNLYFKAAQKVRQPPSKSEVAKIRAHVTEPWFRGVLDEARKCFADRVVGGDVQHSVELRPILPLDFVRDVLRTGAKQLATERNILRLRVPAMEISKFASEAPEEYQSALLQSTPSISDLKSFTVDSLPSLAPVALSESAQTYDAPKLVLVGDTHGTIEVIDKIISSEGFPAENKTVYLFNGDYVDRGSFSIEIFVLLLAVKIAYPEAIYLLRGNHETEGVNNNYSFKPELARKYLKPEKSGKGGSDSKSDGQKGGKSGGEAAASGSADSNDSSGAESSKDAKGAAEGDSSASASGKALAAEDQSPESLLKVASQEDLDAVYGEFSAAFRSLPLCALINDWYLVLHGGIPGWTGIVLNDIDRLNRFREPDTHEGKEYQYFDPLQDILWADPTEETSEMRFNMTRGTSNQFGENAVKRFLGMSNVQYLIRSHACVQDGWQADHGCKTYTLFSVPNYAGTNLGAYAVFFGLYDKDHALTDSEKAVLGQDATAADQYSLSPTPPVCFIRKFTCSENSAIVNQPLCEATAFPFFFLGGRAYEDGDLLDLEALRADEELAEMVQAEVLSNPQSFDITAPSPDREETDAEEALRRLPSDVVRTPGKVVRLAACTTQGRIEAVDVRDFNGADFAIQSPLAQEGEEWFDLTLYLATLSLIVDSLGLDNAAVLGALPHWAKPRAIVISFNETMECTMAELGAELPRHAFPPVLPASILRLALKLCCMPDQGDDYLRSGGFDEADALMREFYEELQRNGVEFPIDLQGDQEGGAGEPGQSSRTIEDRISLFGDSYFADVPDSAPAGAAAPVAEQPLKEPSDDPSEESSEPAAREAPGPRRQKRGAKSAGPASRGSSGTVPRRKK